MNSSTDCVEWLTICFNGATQMRQRGADVTDIVILVVAANEGIKEQTIDSLTAARSAGKPVIVAFNKVRS